MEEGEEKEQLCYNCKRHVTSTNFTTHSAYCEKNIFVCKICNEPVKKTERDEHLEEYHVTLQCELCEAAIEKWMLPEHMEICPRRLIICEYCEAEFPLNEYSEHVDFCGSRTEKCLLCKKYIMIKDKAKHTELHRCEEVYRRKRLGEIEQNKVNELISVLEKSIEEKPTKAKYDYSGSLKMHLNKRVSENVGGIKELVPDEASSNIRQTEQDLNIQSLEGAVGLPNKTKEKSNRYGKCHICEQLIPWIDMNTHIPNCATLAGKCSMCGEHVPSHEMKKHMKEHMSGYSKKMQVKESHDNNLSSAKVNVPSVENCPYCSHSYSKDEIREHIRVCPNYLYTCPLCYQDMCVKDKIKHEKYECRVILEDSMTRSYSSRSAFVSFFECPLCSENVPEENRDRHITFDCKSLLKSSGPQGLFNIRDDSSNVYECPICLESILEKDKKRHELFECKILIENAGIQIPGEPEPESYSEVTKRTCQCKCCKNSSDVCKCRKKISENRTAESKKSCQREKVSCQFCKEDVDSSCEEIHLKYCPATNSKKNFSEHRSNNQNSRKSNSEFKGAKPKKAGISEMMRPQIAKCKYCQTSLNMDIVKYHEEECVQRPVGCPDCAKTIQVKDLGVHKCKKERKKDGKDKNQEGPEEKNEPGIGKKILNFFTKSDKDESGSMNRRYQDLCHSYPDFSLINAHEAERRRRLQSSRTDDALIPCEFCNESFPASRIVLHETGCQPALVSFHKQGSSRNSNVNESSTMQDGMFEEYIRAQCMKLSLYAENNPPDESENNPPSSSSPYECNKYRRKSDTEPGEFLTSYVKSPPKHDNSQMKKNEYKEKKEPFSLQSVWNATSFTYQKTNDEDTNEISERSEVAMQVDQSKEPDNKYERDARCVKGNAEPTSEEIDSDVTAMLSFLDNNKNNESDEEQNEYSTNDNSSENSRHKVLDSDLLNEDLQERHEKDFSDSKKDYLTGESTTVLREHLRFSANSTKKEENVCKIRHSENSIFGSYKTVDMPREQIAHETDLSKKNNDRPEKSDKKNIPMYEKEYITSYKEHLSDFKYASQEEMYFSDEDSKVCTALYEKDDKEYEKLYDLNDIDITKDEKECVNSFKYLADLNGAHNSTALSCKDSTHETVIQKKDEEQEKLSAHLSRLTVSTKDDKECIDNIKKYFPDFRFASNEKISVSVEDNKCSVRSKRNDKILSEDCQDKSSKHIDRVKDKTVWASNFNQHGDFKFDTHGVKALSSQNNVHETILYEKKDDEPEKLHKQISQHVRTKDESKYISNYKKHFPDFKFATHKKPSLLKSEKNYEKLSDKSSKHIDSKVKTECAGNFSQLSDYKFGINESAASFSQNKVNQTVQREKRDKLEKLNQQKVSQHIYSAENEKGYENDFSNYLPDFKFSSYKTRSSSSKSNTHHASLTERKDGHFEKTAFKLEPVSKSSSDEAIDVKKGLEDLEAKIAKFHLQNLGTKNESVDPTKWSKWRTTQEKSSDSSDSD